MASQEEVVQKIGEGFILEYYRRFDSADWRSVGELYFESACSTWEGQVNVGREAIIGKLASLPFRTIQHVTTEKDVQLTGDNAILIMVMGQLKADEDPIMGFQQVFLLRLANGSWGCTNDMFRLSIHNFGA
ncbi:nuclear transport factor 2-like [Lampris incognitus]|uniref:nuclear transport factor 2-like n=1 Tax=Lampris incognitus TaxID=2546036 RepID=UPI0024B5214B|nr:nuclear transport factor 2-like [Lampris incognitus]XP_056154724.1 nuclear transport factor 2-like [Lampris incognitus]